MTSASTATSSPPAATYVGAPPVEDDGEPFEEKMAELTAKLYEQFDEAHRLEMEIRKNLELLGYDQDVIKR
jgi:type I restriction enzyme M protein